MIRPIKAGWQRPRSDDVFHFKHIPGALASLPRVVRLVWSASPPLTILLGLLNLMQGFIPASSVSVTALLIDSVVRAIQSPTHSLRMVLFFVALQLGITLFSSLLNTLSNIAQQLMQEQVSNRVQLDILKKASTLDLSFFENPEFYDKMRQAANQSLYQPVSMISQTFDLFRTAVTLVSLIALLVTLAWWLALIALIVPIPAFFSSKRYGVLRHITLGQLVLYTQAAVQVGQNFQGLLNDISSTYENTLYINTLFEFLEYQPKIVSPPRPKPIESPRVGERARRSLYRSARHGLPVLPGPSPDSA